MPNMNQLAIWVTEARVHKQIVGGYGGAYALGLIDAPPRFLLRVEGQDVSQFPTVVTIDGESCDIEVHGGFVPPQGQTP